MKAITEENTQSKELNADLQTKVKLKSNRPNIDHLIKRILIERRAQERKNLLTLIVVVSAIIVIGIYIYN